mgnify:FL=1
MLKVKEFDRVLLKDGREGDVMDVSEDGVSLVIDTGSSPEDWKTLYDKTIYDVEKVIT